VHRHLRFDVSRTIDDVSAHVRTGGRDTALVQHRVVSLVERSPRGTTTAMLVAPAVDPTWHRPPIGHRIARRIGRQIDHRRLARLARRSQSAARSTIAGHEHWGAVPHAYAGSYRCRRHGFAATPPESVTCRCGAVAPSHTPLEECLGYASRAVLVAGQNPGQPPPGGRLQVVVRYALVRTQTDAGDCSERRAPVDWRRAMPMPASRNAVHCEPLQSSWPGADILHVVYDLRVRPAGWLHATLPTGKKTAPRSGESAIATLNWRSSCA